MPTVREVLERPRFLHAELVAGHDGVNRWVRWIHILETSHMGDALRGEELILTAGMSLKESTARTAYLQGLATAGVSALFVELGEEIAALPPDVIRWSNAHAIPVAVFRQSIHFIDLVEDVSRLILAEYPASLTTVATFTQRLTDRWPAGDPVEHALLLLSETLGAGVTFRSSHTGDVTYPRGTVSLLSEAALEGAVPQGEEWTVDTAGQGRIYGQAVYHQGVRVGTLVASVHQHAASDYVRLIMAAAAGHLGRVSRVHVNPDRAAIMAEGQWVEDVIHGRPADGPVSANGPLSIGGVIVIGLREVSPAAGQPIASDAYIAMVQALRRLCNRQGFHLWMSAHTGVLVLIVQPRHAGRKWPAVIPWALPYLVVDMLAVDFALAAERWGYAAFDCPRVPVDEAYRRAGLAGSLRQHLPHLPPAYEGTGVYALIAQLAQVAPDALRRFTLDSLHPFSQEPPNQRHTLLTTLRAYLDAGGSAQRAASLLHIHRQTLYYRLEHLRQLYGTAGWSLDDPEVRAALLLALRCHDLAPVELGSGAP